MPQRRPGVHTEPRQAHRNDAPYVQELPLGLTHSIKHPDQEDLRGGFHPNLIAQPTDPLQEIRVVTREADETQRLLQQ